MAGAERAIFGLRAYGDWDGCVGSYGVSGGAGSVASCTVSAPSSWRT